MNELFFFGFFLEGSLEESQLYRFSEGVVLWLGFNSLYTECKTVVICFWIFGNVRMGAWWNFFM